jgi:hypothetical protein
VAAKRVEEGGRDIIRLGRMDLSDGWKIKNADC